MTEKRRLERFDLHIPATIEFLNLDHKEKTLNLLTTNICSGGAYFHITQPLTQGTQATIELVLPLDRLRKFKREHKQAYIRVTGRVLRSESEGMAICFDEDYQIMGSDE
jgi:hypothetical protein